MAAFLPLLAAGALASYALSQAQANVDARNVIKNAVDGTQDNKSYTRKKFGMDPSTRMAMPLSTLDEVTTRINEGDSNSKLTRKRVPTIPGVTRTKPYTSMLPNNASVAE